MAIDDIVHRHHERMREVERQGYDQGRTGRYSSNPEPRGSVQNDAWNRSFEQGRRDHLYPSSGGNSYRR